MPPPGIVGHLIADAYTPDQLSEIKDVLARHGSHEITSVAHGLFAASGSQQDDSLSGYQNLWVRDNVMVANSFRLRGMKEVAVACMKGLTKYFQTQAPRFREIVGDPVGVLKLDPNRRPHIRFRAKDLAELPERWAHAQNDALGQALWFRFVLANSGDLPLSESEWKLYGLFPDYFEAIKFWQDLDSGPWEEGVKINNSSIGCVVAGLEELQRFVAAPERREDEVAALVGPHVERIQKLIAKGRARMDDTLPFEAPPERMVDSALLLLVHPLNLLRSRARENSILNLVQARLKGEFGIKRYAGDSYFCQDYDEWFAPGAMSGDFSDRHDFRDAFLQPNCEAQWCIFDPQLSVIYGERFLEDPADEASYQKQVHYFNRSLRQITPDGHCPELYFQKQGRYVPNAHTPLAWTQANQALALHLLEQSIAKRTGAKK